MPQFGPPAANSAGNSSVAVINEYLDVTKAPYFADPTGSSDCSAAINQAFVDATSRSGPQNKVLVPAVGLATFKCNSQIQMPDNVTLLLDGGLVAGSDFGYGVPLILPTGSVGKQRIQGHGGINGPYSSYSPHYGEVPCLMSGVKWAGGMWIEGIAINRFLYGIETNDPGTNGTDHCRLSGLAMNGNYAHLRFNPMVDTGNQIIRDMRTEQQTLACVSIASGAFLGGGSEVENLWNSFGPVGILFEDGTAGEAGILSTIFTNMQFESLGHAVYYDERFVLWNGASSGHDYKNNRHIGCGSFGFPGGGTVIEAGRIQFVDLGGATGGTYTLTFVNSSSVSQTTATITPSSSTPNATDAATIRTRLLALSNMPGTSPNPAGNVMVLPCFNGYRVHFQGAFVGTAQNVMTITSSLTGTGTSPRVVDAVPSKAWEMLLNGITVANKFDAIDQMVGQSTSGTSGGLYATNAGNNNWGSTANLIAQQQSHGDGWQALRVGPNSPTPAGLNFGTAGVGVYDANIPYEIGLVRTFGGSGSLIERGDVVAMVQEGGESDLTGTAEQYGAHGSQDVVPWGVALTDGYRTSDGHDCVLIARGGRFAVKTAVATTIAAGVKVMPDASNPGCVVTWTTGNPVVGVSRAASSATSVGGRSNGRAAIPGVRIDIACGL